MTVYSNGRFLDAVREYKARHDSRLANVSFDAAVRESAEAQPRSDSYRQSRSLSSPHLVLVPSLRLFVSRHFGAL